MTQGSRSRGNRRSSRPGDRPRLSLPDTIAGRAVILAGLFSAKEKDYQATMDRLAARVVAYGGSVIAQFVQRRGVSDGGVKRMQSPFSSRTVLGSGKIREVAEACRASDAGAVIFANILTDHQRMALEETLGSRVFSIADLP